MALFSRRHDTDGCGAPYAWQISSANEFSWTTTDLKPGVDVMIKIFGDFRQFSTKSFVFFSKTNVMIKFLRNLALF
jgi:hypothetical protein